MQAKEEIIPAFRAAGSALCEFIRQQPDELFEVQPGGKWSAGQHLDHMIRSVKPLNLAFRLPRVVLRMSFGKPNRQGRNYDQLVERYKTRLAEGGTATGVFVPPVVRLADKEKLLERFVRQNEKLCRTLSGYSDQTLDDYLLPHPLLGKVTLREMLFFTIYHNQHHLQILKERNNVSA